MINKHNQAERHKRYRQMLEDTTVRWLQRELRMWDDSYSFDPKRHAKCKDGRCDPSDYAIEGFKFHSPLSGSPAGNNKQRKQQDEIP